jgi:predicted TIM-barrel fold metal-dependent hydrolase
MASRDFVPNRIFALAFCTAIREPPHAFPYVDSRLYTPPAAPVEHYLALAAALGIGRGILVQPNVHGYDNAVTLDAISKAGGRLKGMIRARAGMREDELRVLHAQGICAVRFNFARHLMGRFDEKAFRALTELAGRLGWVVDLHIDADLIVEHSELIRSVPAPVVIDHFGRVDGAKGVDDLQFQALLRLLENKNLWVKISGADRLMARGASYEQVVVLARALIAQAPERVVWGTDWPHSFVFRHGSMPNDGDLVNMLLDFAPDQQVRDRILSDNAAQLFGFGG